MYLECPFICVLLARFERGRSRVHCRGSRWLYCCSPITNVGGSGHTRDMVSYSDLTDRAAVHWAVSEFDRLGRDAFLERFGFGVAREDFLVVNGFLYDSKAIFAAAY